MDLNNLSLKDVSAQRLAVVTLLGFSSGLPLALSSGTLQAWFTFSGVDVQTIGLLSVVGLPYVFKFLWAPLLDRYGLTLLGRRKSWMLASQFVIAACLLVMASLAPAEQPFALGMMALLLALFSATQDIAIDAYRTELLYESERGLGISLAVSAYRLALLSAGAGALIVAEKFGFSFAYCVMASLMLIGLLTTWLAPMVADVAATKQHALASFRDAWRSFRRRPQWLALLALVATYKLGDAFAESLTTTFMLREMDLTLTELAWFNKTLGILATIAGGLIAGLVMLKIRLFAALFGFAILQLATNLGFVLLALFGPNHWGIALVVVAENLFGGMGTVALVALIMSLCDRQFTATHFALLTAVAALGRVFSGPIAGLVAHGLGWTTFFGASCLIGFIPVAILLYARQMFYAGIQQRAV
ncbi:MAG: MFS transporter [Pseudomonadota bacterium]